MLVRRLRAGGKLSAEVPAAAQGRRRRGTRRRGQLYSLTWAQDADGALSVARWEPAADDPAAAHDAQAVADAHLT